MYNKNRMERSLGKDFKIQDAFLNHCRRDKIMVTLELVSQKTKNGRIIGFDNQAIILDDGISQQLLYKNAIIAINPQEAVNFIFNDALRHNALDSSPEYTADFA